MKTAFEARGRKFVITENPIDKGKTNFILKYDPNLIRVANF